MISESLSFEYIFDSLSISPYKSLSEMILLCVSSFFIRNDLRSVVVIAWDVTLVIISLLFFKKKFNFTKHKHIRSQSTFVFYSFVSFIYELFFNFSLSKSFYLFLIIVNLYFFLKKANL